MCSKQVETALTGVCSPLNHYKYEPHFWQELIIRQSALKDFKDFSHRVFRIMIIFIFIRYCYIRGPLYISLYLWQVIHVYIHAFTQEM